MLGCSSSEQQSPWEWGPCEPGTLPLAALGGSLNDDGSWAANAPTAGGLSLFPLVRRCQGICWEYFSALEGNFSQVPCAGSLCACVCAGVHVLSGRWERSCFPGL